MKKMILVGILAGALMAIAGFVVNFLFHFISPELQTTYEDTHIFVSWEDPRMWLFWIYPLALGVALAWVYGMLPKPFKKPLKFSWIYFTIGGIPMFFINYGSFNLPFFMIFSWTFMTYINGLIAGLLYSKMLK